MLSQEGYFRALIGAVTLKQVLPPPDQDQRRAFPRLNRRGHIEASTATSV